MQQPNEVLIEEANRILQKKYKDLREKEARRGRVRRTVFTEKRINRDFQRILQRLEYRELTKEQREREKQARNDLLKQNSDKFMEQRLLDEKEFEIYNRRRDSMKVLGATEQELKRMGLAKKTSLSDWKKAKSSRLKSQRKRERRN